MREPTHYWKGGIRGYSDTPVGPIHVITDSKGQRTINKNGEIRTVDSDGVIHWLPPAGIKKLKPEHMTGKLL